MLHSKIPDTSKQTLETYNILDGFRNSISRNNYILKAKLIFKHKPNCRLYYRLVWNAFIDFLCKRNKAYIHRDKLVGDILEAVKVFITRYQQVIRNVFKTHHNVNDKQKNRVTEF